GSAVEQSLERFHFRPGAFAVGGVGGDTPVADDKGPIRVDDGFAARLVEGRLQANLGDRVTVAFDTNAFDLRPGTVVALTDHDEPVLREPQLVVGTRILGTDV